MEADPEEIVFCDEKNIVRWVEIDHIEINEEKKSE
jgi:hypothetical protein